MITLNTWSIDGSPQNYPGSNFPEFGVHFWFRPNSGFFEGKATFRVPPTFAEKFTQDMSCLEAAQMVKKATFSNMFKPMDKIEAVIKYLEEWDVDDRRSGVEVKISHLKNIIGQAEDQLEQAEEELKSLS